MGCPYHIAHNAASKATKVFLKVADNFDVEALLVGIYFHFDYSSKRKNSFVEFCDLCDQQYCKIIKFHSVRWFGMSPCIKRVLRLLSSLKSYFESLDPEMKNGVEIKSKINRLINAFKCPLLNELLRFFDSALPPLMQLNLLSQRVDPLIHILYDSLFSCTYLLLSKFAQPEIVRQYKMEEIAYEEIKVEVMKTVNVLENERLFVGFLVPEQVNALLSHETVTERQVQNFYAGCLEFHRTTFLYAIKNFLIKDEFLIHVRFLDFYDQKCTCESVLFVAQKLKHYVHFKKKITQ